MFVLRYALAFVLFIAFSSAEAQVQFGIVAGAGASPDALEVGGHVRTDVGNSGFVVIPSAVYAFGSLESVLGGIDFTGFRGSLHATYEIPLDRRGEFVFYPLAGGSVFYRSVSNCNEELILECTSTVVGADAGAGLGFGAFFIEGFAGIGDLPDATLRIKYTFGR